MDVTEKIFPSIKLRQINNINHSRFINQPVKKEIGDYQNYTFNPKHFAESLLNTEYTTEFTKILPCFNKMNKLLN